MVVLQGDAYMIIAEGVIVLIIIMLIQKHWKE